MSLKSVLIAAAAALALTTSAAGAQTPPTRLTLSYDGMLYFIKVLDLQFQQKIDNQGFAAGAQLRSYGILAAFKHFDIKASAEGRMDGDTPRPGAFDYINHDGKRVRHVKVDWKPDTVAMTSTPAFSDLGSPPASLEQRQASADPLTQLMRLTVGAPACVGAPLFFDGKQLYELAFAGAHDAAPTPEQRALGVTAVTTCTMKYNEIAGFKKKSPAKRGGGLTSPITVAFGQIGAGGPWVIDEVRASTPLGPAVIVLRQTQISHG
jgi:hypothetical protein